MIRKLAGCLFKVGTLWTIIILASPLQSYNNFGHILDRPYVKVCKTTCDS